MLEDKPPTEVEFADAIQRIQDFFSHEETLNHLSESLYTNSRRPPIDVHSNAANNGHFAGNAMGKRLKDSESTQVQVASGSIPSPHMFGPPPSKFGGTLPHREVRPDMKAWNLTSTLRPPSIQSAHTPTDVGGALVAYSPSEEHISHPREETLPEPDNVDSQVPALPARRTWRLDGTDRRTSDDEEVPIERNALERNRSSKMDGINMPVESGLSSSLRAARAGVVDRDFAAADDTENTEAESGQNSFTPRLPNITSDRVVSPTLAKERTTSSTASNLMWKLRLGIPQGVSGADVGNERSMKYLHIPERGREQFQQFAKALKDKLSVECAESNPYVKALCAHRQEMADSGLDLGREAVDSLPARLATERSDALASMEMTEDFMRDRQNCDLYCHRSHCETRHRWDMMELHLPEMEERLRRRNGGARVPSPTTQAIATSDRSTTAASQRSELEVRRVVFNNNSNSSGDQAGTLSLRIGRNRLELAEDDRVDFLSAIGCAPEGLPVTSTPSNVSIPKDPVRTCEGDISPSPQVEAE